MKESAFYILLSLRGLFQLFFRLGRRLACCVGLLALLVGASGGNSTGTAIFLAVFFWLLGVFGAAQYDKLLFKLTPEGKELYLSQ